VAAPRRLLRWSVALLVVVATVTSGGCSHPSERATVSLDVFDEVAELNPDLLDGVDHRTTGPGIVGAAFRFDGGTSVEEALRVPGWMERTPETEQRDVEEISSAGELERYDVELGWSGVVDRDDGPWTCNIQALEQTAPHRADLFVWCFPAE
jgi:hypothetical protein